MVVTYTSYFIFAQGQNRKGHKYQLRSCRFQTKKFNFKLSIKQGRSEGKIEAGLCRVEAGLCMQDLGRIEAGCDALVHDVRQDKKLQNSKTKCDRNVHQ